MELNHLKEIIAECCPGTDLSNVSAETPLSELGLDSLDLATIIFQIENEEGIEVDPDSITKIETLADAIRLIEETEE